MKKLQINKEVTPAELDRFLALDDIGEHYLVIPEKFSNSASLGMSIVISQFILAWSRKCATPEIHISIGEQTHENQKSYISRLHGLASTFYSEKVFNSNSTKELNEIRFQLLKSAKSRIEAMTRTALKSTSKTPNEVEFIFIGGATNEFHKALYTKKPRYDDLNNKEEHGKLILESDQLKWLIAKCFAATKTSVNQTYATELSKKLGHVLHEAFRNTAEHAYSYHDGSLIEKNLRAIRIAKVQTNKKHLTEFQVSSTEAQKYASKYFNQIKESVKNSKRETIDILEISILDSGSGFASTIHKDHYQDESDECLVARCFEKHASSKPGEGSGIGLYRIMKCIDNLNGFLRVRTSKSEAFYVKNIISDRETKPTDFVFGGLPQIEGTSIIIGIPIT